MSTQHTPGPWSQGRTLGTPQTRKWTSKQWADNDARERTMVFANFREDDQGRSRQLVADCCSTEADARLIAAAPDLLAALIDLTTRCDGEEGVRADGSNIQTMRAHAAIAKAESADMEYTAAHHLTRDEVLARLKLMETYGGGFASALAKAWYRADGNNDVGLRQAFGDLLEDYAPEKWSR
jgi:hypothetical protein